MSSTVSTNQEEFLDCLDNFYFDENLLLGPSLPLLNTPLPIDFDEPASEPITGQNDPIFNDYVLNEAVLLNHCPPAAATGQNVVRCTEFHQPSEVIAEFSFNENEFVQNDHTYNSQFQVEADVTRQYVPPSELLPEPTPVPITHTITLNDSLVTACMTASDRKYYFEC